MRSIEEIVETGREKVERTGSSNGVGVTNAAQEAVGGSGGTRS